MGMGDISGETIVGVRLTLRQWVLLIGSVATLSVVGVTARNEVMGELRSMRMTLESHTAYEEITDGSHAAKMHRLDELVQDLRSRLSAVEQHIRDEGSEHHLTPGKE